ncbi:MAG: PEGA domain-containing protein [Ignavibacteriales bacterium]|nr:PEGA domain-containing protein [Ignavibacteriales bacterium]
MLNEALIEYQKAVNLDASIIDVHLKCGDIYIKMKDLEKAEASFQKVAVISPNNPELMVSLFNLYRLQEIFDKAIKIGEEILSSQPENIEIHKTLKDIYVRSERYQDAMKELEILSNLIPTDSEVLNELAQRYELHGESEKAFTVYQKLNKLQPDNMKVIFCLGKYTCLLGNYEKGIEYLKRSISSVSDELQSYGHLLLAYSSLKLNKHYQATHEISQVSALYDDNLSDGERKIYAETFYEIGNEYFRKKELHSATHYLRIAIKYNPNDKNIQNCIDNTQKISSEINRKLRKKYILIGSISIFLIIIFSLAWYIAHGKIEVSVKPSEGTSVYVDGELIPNISNQHTLGDYFSSSLFIGTHKVTIENARYKVWDTIINVDLQKTTKLNIKLNPKYGSFRVMSNPEDADVYVDGQLMGKTPLFINKIQVGKYNLNLKLRFYAQSNSSIEVNDTVNGKIYFDLSRGSAELILHDSENWIRVFKVGDEEKHQDRSPVHFTVTAGERVPIWYRFINDIDWKYAGSLVLETGETKSIDIYSTGISKGVFKLK